MKIRFRYKLVLTVISVLLLLAYGCTMSVERVRFVENNKEEAVPEPEIESGSETDGTEQETSEENAEENNKEDSVGEEEKQGESEESQTESENESLENHEPAKETDSENESEQQNQTESENEQQSQTDSESENQKNEETESETPEETEPNTEQGNETVQEPEPESEPEPEPEPELELPPDPMQEMPEPPKLTLVVYMAADNDLESYAIQNLKAMEHADYSKMNVLVLLDRSEGFDETNGDWTDTRLFELVHDETDSNIIVSKRISCPPLGLSNKVETELDMGNPSVLWNLLNFARNNYESEKYALIIWGHGTGWRYSAGNLNAGENSNVRAAAIDDRTGSYMSVHDMGRALRNQGLSVIGFDTCFGGVFENVYELKNHAEYTVASPGITPSGGWDYKNLLEDMSDSYFSAKEIAEAMAENSLVNITVFNNQKLYTLMSDIEEFSKSLAATIKNSSTRNTVYSKLLTVKSYSYTQYPCDMYLDIHSMADVFKSNSDSTLSSAAKKLQKSVNAAAKTTNTKNAEIGIHFIPKTSANTTAVSHSIDYIKDIDNSDQCMFIKESQGWVPTKNGESESLLDKLFYSSL